MDIQRWLTATALATEPSVQQIEPRPLPLHRSDRREAGHGQSRGRHQERRHRHRRVESPNAASELRPAHQPEFFRASPPVSRPPKRLIFEAEKANEALHVDDGIKHAPDPYTRRKRHKTREDRYDPSKQKTTVKVKYKKKQDSGDAPKIRKHKKPKAVDIMSKFHADNITKERLTLKTDVGMLSRGRASRPLPTRGVPDLTFSEMRFLRKTEPVSAAPSRNPADLPADNRHAQFDQNTRQSHHFQLPRAVTPAEQAHVPPSSKLVGQLRSPLMVIPETSLPQLTENPGLTEPRLAEMPLPAATSYLSWSSSRRGGGEEHTFTRGPILAPSKSSSLLDMERIRATVILDHDQPFDLPRPSERPARRQHTTQDDHLEPRPTFAIHSIGSDSPLAIVPQPQRLETRLMVPSDRSEYRLLSNSNPNTSSRYDARNMNNHIHIPKSRSSIPLANSLLRPAVPYPAIPKYSLHGAWSRSQYLSRIPGSENRPAEPSIWYQGASEHNLRPARISSRLGQNGDNQMMANGYPLEYDQLCELDPSQIAPDKDTGYGPATAQLSEPARYEDQRPDYHDLPVQNGNEWTDQGQGYLWTEEQEEADVQSVIIDWQHQLSPEIEHDDTPDQRPSFIPQNFWGTRRIY